MRLSRPLIASSIVLLAVAAAVSTGVASAASAESAEISRIRTHFDSVLAELSTRDLGALRSEQFARRTALLATLREYRARSAFPHNDDFPGQRVPYFVDRKTGTLCAVAHLLASTGRRDIVDRVARANNNVWVAQLAGDTAFTGWLETHGLSLEEAAFIQVPYAMSPAQQNTQLALGVTALAVTGVTMGSAMITSFVNGLDNPDGYRTRMSSWGVVTGVMTAGLGVAALNSRALPSSVGASGIALGVTSFTLGMRARHSRASFLAQQEAARPRGIAQTSFAPVITTSNGGRAGVAVSMRF